METADIGGLARAAIRDHGGDRAPRTSGAVNDQEPVDYSRRAQSGSELDIQERDYIDAQAAPTPEVRPRAAQHRVRPRPRAREAVGDSLRFDGGTSDPCEAGRRDSVSHRKTGHPGHAV